MYAVRRANSRLVIADSGGRTDRRGATVISIGAAGVTPLRTTEHCGKRQEDNEGGGVDAPPPAVTLPITGAAGAIGTRLAADLAAQGCPGVRAAAARPAADTT